MELLPATLVAPVTVEFRQSISSSAAAVVAVRKNTLDLTETGMYVPLELMNLVAFTPGRMLARVEVPHKTLIVAEPLATAEEVLKLPNAVSR